MAALTERLAYLITVDNTSAVKGFKQVGQAAEKELGKAESAFSKLSRNSTKFLTAGIAATSVLFGMAKQASNVQEAVNRINVVFGSTAGQIRDWADNAKNALGISEAAALSAANTFGTFGKAMGLVGNDLSKFAMDATQLGVDLASAFNTNAEDAINAIGAALRGEAEPIRAYGVLLDEATIAQKALEMGIISTTKQALTPQQRALAAYQVILDQTKDAQGDFARTQDGFAGAMKTLQSNLADLTADMGAAALPVFTKIIGALQGLVDVANAIPAPIKTAGATALVAASFITLLGGAALKAAGFFQIWYQRLSLNIQGLRLLGVQALTARSALMLVGSAAGAIGAALFVGWTVLQTFNKGQEETAARAKEVAEALDGEVDALFAFKAQANDSFVTAADAQKAFAKAVLNAGEDGKKAAQSLGALNIGADRLIPTFQALQENARSAFDQIMAGNDIFGEHKAAVLSVIDSEEDLNNIFTLLSGQGIELTDVQKDMVRALEELQDQAEKTDLSKSAEEFLNSAAASDDATAALVLQAEAMTGVTRDGAGAITVYEKFLELLGREELKTAPTYISQQRASLDELEDTLGEVEEAYRAALNAARSFYGINLDAEEQQLEMNNAYNEWLWIQNDGKSSQEDRTRASIAARREMVNTIETLTAQRLAQQGLTEDTATAVQKKNAELAVIDELKGKYPMLLGELVEYSLALNAVPTATATDIKIVKDGAVISLDQWIKDLGDIPPHIRSQIDAALNQGNYDYVVKKLAELERTRIARVTAVFSGNKGQVGNNASGTNNWRGGPTWVGERGPELMDLPAGTKISSNAQSQRLAGLSGGGGGSVVNNYYSMVFNVPPTADLGGIGQKVVEAIKAYERRSGKGWRS